MTLSMARNALIASVLLAWIAGLPGCSRKDSVEVRLDSTQTQSALSSTRGPKPLRIGMGAMITPKEGYLYYQELKAYLAEKIGRPIELVDRDNYSQMKKMLANRELEISFVGSGLYVEGHDTHGLEIIAVPEMNSATTYYAFIILPKDSPARQMRDLRGTTFAFTDPMSNTGKLVPTYMLARMGETPESFFKKVIYTHGHDKSIKAVAEHFADGASVDSHIWNLYVRNHPETAAKVKVITKSPPYGIPPLVAVPGFDPLLKKSIRAALFGMNGDPAGKQILKRMNIDRFVPQSDKSYDTIRSMNARLAHQKVKK